MEDKLYAIGFYEYRDDIDVTFNEYDTIKHDARFTNEIWIDVSLFVSEHVPTRFIEDKYLNHWIGISYQLMVFYTTSYEVACEAYNGRVEWVLDRLEKESQGITQKTSKLNKLAKMGE